MSFHTFYNTFELDDGRTLRVQWESYFTPASYHDESDMDDGEPEWYLDGVRVYELPKGLEDIAVRLYEQDERQEDHSRYARNRTALAQQYRVG